MKKNVFILLFLLPAISWGQKTYVSLKQCNNDTLKYLKTNFINNKERYLNQPFSKLSQEFELDIYISEVFSGRAPKESEVWGIEFFYFYPSEDFYWIRANRCYYWFLIEFERPYINSIGTIYKSPLDYSWKSEKNKYRELFNNCIIKDMDLRPGFYRNPDEKRRAKVGWKERKWN